MNLTTISHHTFESILINDHKHETRALGHAVVHAPKVRVRGSNPAVAAQKLAIAGGNRSNDVASTIGVPDKDCPGQTIGKSNSYPIIPSEKTSGDRLREPCNQIVIGLVGDGHKPANS